LQSNILKEKFGKLFIIRSIDIFNNTLSNNVVTCAPSKKIINLKFYYSTRNKTFTYAEKQLCFDTVTKLRIWIFVK